MREIDKMEIDGFGIDVNGSEAAVIYIKAKMNRAHYRYRVLFADNEVYVEFMGALGTVYQREHEDRTLTGMIEKMGEELIDKAIHEMETNRNDWNFSDLIFNHIRTKLKSERLKRIFK